MSLSLSPTLSKYFAAQNAHNVEKLVDCFAIDAKVRDEGEDIVGHDEIRAWAEKVRDKYNVTVTPLRSSQADGCELVTARVEGTFPGSPIELTYQFSIIDGQIASLKVL